MFYIYEIGSLTYHLDLFGAGLNTAQGVSAIKRDYLIDRTLSGGLGA